MLRGLRARSGTFVAAPVTVTSALASGANAARSIAASATRIVTTRVLLSASHLGNYTVENKLQTGWFEIDFNGDSFGAALSVSRTQRLLLPARAGGSWWCFHSVGRRVSCHDSHDDTR